MKKVIILIFVFLGIHWITTGKNHDLGNLNALPGIPLLHDDGEYQPSRPQKAVYDTSIANMMLRISSDSIQSYIQHLQDYGSRFCLKPGHKNISLWLQYKLQSFGYGQVVLDSFQITTEWPRGSGTFVTNWQYNVVANQTGAVSPNVQYIIGGHYDAIVQSGDPYLACPGADDNASGTAATLEIARVLKQYNFLFPATIKFILFDAEELGLYGSEYHVQKMLAAHQIPQAMFNLDMIGNEPGDSAWVVQFNSYVGAEWMLFMGADIADRYTQLGTYGLIFTEAIGSDSDPFFAAGLPSIFLQEDHFSPNYHTLADRDTNLNMPYCADVTRVACGMLMEASLTPALVKFEIFNPGTGHSLIPRWRPNPEANIGGYKIYVGTSALNYDTVYTTADTSFNLTGLTNGTQYYIAVSAFNTLGREGMQHELSDAPALATLDQGVLIVDDSEWGYYNPPDSTVDAYYRYICRNFTISEYDAIQNGAPTLADLGPYSSVVWHINKPNVLPKLRNSLQALKQYMQLGGNVFFTLFQPSKMFVSTTTMSSVWREGSFLHDMLKIDTTLIKSNAVCIGAMPTASVYNLLQVDTNKTIPVNQHHLLYIDALYPSPEGTAVYAYQSNYAPASAQGSMQGLTIGVEYRSSGYNAVLLSIPLYYCDSTQSTDLMNYILGTVFAEEPNSIPTQNDAASWATLYPNPAHDVVIIKTHAAYPPQESVCIYDLTGRLLKTVGGLTGYQNSLNIAGLPQGLYYLHIKCGDKDFKSSLLIMD